MFSAKQGKVDSNQLPTSTDMCRLDDYNNRLSNDDDARDSVSELTQAKCVLSAFNSIL